MHQHETHLHPTAQEIKDLDLRVEISEEEINTAIKQIAFYLNNKYTTKNNVVLMCMLNGAKPFFDKLTPKLTFNPNIDYIKISCYGESTEPSEAKLTQKPNTTNFLEKTIILIDELIDSGRTLETAKKYFLSQSESKAVFTVSLFNRTVENRQFNADLTGMDIIFPQERFLIGFGLDYKNRFRNLVNVYSMRKPDLANTIPISSNELLPSLINISHQSMPSDSKPEQVNESPAKCF